MDACLEERIGASVKRVDSEHECDLMIEALSKELIIVRVSLCVNSNY